MHFGSRRWCSGGGEDRVFDASGAEVLRTHLPQAHISALAGMGHLPMREAPGNTAHQYADFLQGMARHGTAEAPN